MSDKLDTTTSHEVVREYFPNASDEECEFILWEKTGYPSFFAPEEGKTIADELRRQLKNYVDIRSKRKDDNEKKI